MRLSALTPLLLASSSLAYNPFARRQAPSATSTTFFDPSTTLGSTTPITIASSTSTSSAAASPSPSLTPGGCPLGSTCPPGQYCRSSGANLNGCFDFDDCRKAGCPGGSCVMENYDPTADPLSPYVPFECKFAPASSSSSSASQGPSASVSSSGTPTSSGSSASASPTSFGDCKVNTDCPSTQYCWAVGHGLNICKNYDDCRGPTGCGSDKNAICQPQTPVPANETRSPDVPFVCRDRVGCQITGCPSGNYCSFVAYNNNTSDQYQCIPNNITCTTVGCPAGSACTQVSAPGGTTYECQASNGTFPDCGRFGCPTGQRCERTSSNGGIDGRPTGKCVVDAAAVDCRVKGCGPEGNGAQCGFAYVPGLLPAYQCISNGKPDCRIGGCTDQSTCTFYSRNNYTAFVCADPIPPAQDCRNGTGCPGGLCGWNGNFFQCFFNVTSSTSIRPSSSSSTSSGGPTSSGPISISTSSSRVPPPPSSSVVPPPPISSSSVVPPPSSAPPPPPPVSSSSPPPPPPASSSTPPPPPPASSSTPPPPPPPPASSSPAPPSPSCSARYDEIISLLKGIQTDVAAIKLDVAAIKANLGI